MENYRTFVGIPLKVDARFLSDREELMHFLAMERISWVRPLNYHLTLRFLGDVAEGRMEDLGAALDRHLMLPGAKAVQLTGVGVFGPRKKPRVIWVGFEEEEYFRKLHGQVEAALESCGFPRSGKPFRPHLTLGRIRSLKEMQEFYTTMDGMDGRFAGCLHAESIVLFRSVLKPEGPVYLPLKSWEFPT